MRGCTLSFVEGVKPNIPPRNKPKKTENRLLRRLMPLLGVPRMLADDAIGRNRRFMGSEFL